MLVALATEDYDRLASEYIDLAPFSDGVDANQLARETRDVISPYYGLTMKEVNMAKVLLTSTSLATKHHLQLPRELMLFFKSLVGIESLGRMLVIDFDFLSYSLEIAKELVKARYEPTRMVSNLASVMRESQGMLFEMPRQLRNFFRKVNHPDFAIKLNVEYIEETKRAIETSSNILFLGIVIGSLIISASILYALSGLDHGMPLLSILGYSLAVFFGMMGFYNYIKK